MSYTAPRASFLGADRVWGFNVDFHGASMHTSNQGPGSVPAYSEDSDILAVNFQEPQPDGEGGLVCRRIPGEHDGKEWTSLLPTGGANAGIAWCPTNNKFYLGVGQHQLASSKGMVAVFDPSADTCEILGGFSPTNGLATAGRAIWIESTGRVWVLANIGNPKRFAIIDPADNSVTMLEDINIPLASDIAQSPTELWISGVDASSSPFLPRLSRLNTSTMAVTTVLNETIFETWKGSGVTNFSIGAIEYISSIGEVWAALAYNEGFGTEPWILRLDSAGAIIALHSLLPASYFYYVEAFDRVIFANAPPSFGLNWVNPADNSLGSISATDAMTATKGCFCANRNKVALPVLTGPGGARFHTVNFYSAADLGA
jgi:hypothetical protein